MSGLITLVSRGEWLHLPLEETLHIWCQSPITLQPSCDFQRGAHCIKAVQPLFKPSHSLAVRSVSAGTFAILIRYCFTAAFGRFSADTSMTI